MDKNKKISSLPDSSRRAVIKKSMQLAVAAYVAPVTMQLLTATRATAQSAVAPAACGCATVTITNGNPDDVDLIYDDCSRGDTTVTVTGTSGGRPDGVVTISVRVGTTITYLGGDPLEGLETLVCDNYFYEMPG